MMSGAYFSRYAPLFDEVRAFNEEQFEQGGTTPQGVGWNSVEAQLIRFEQVLRVLPSRREGVVSFNDIGCGYGALLDYLPDRGQSLDYRGYEVSARTLERAKELHPESSARIFKPFEQLTPADYSIASGIFGLKFSHTEEYWRQYVLDTLDVFDESSVRGFAFNMLTSYSDNEKKRAELYYADPCAIFDFCKRKYSRNVALYHDYSLYDFTIVVRKG
jgi:SAM-dependent methyltransferase